MITVNNRNEVYLQIDTDAGILLELNDFFTFTVPGAQFTPQYRAKLWDGKIRLLNIFSRELYVGLLPYIQDFCEKNQYQFVDNTTAHYDNIDSLESFIADLDFQSNGKSIEMRDYQLDAVKTALTRNRTLLLSPTASGKSLIIYTIMRWHQAQNRKQLIIVPTTSLVEQLYGDFNDYASTTDWNAADHCAKIYSGKEKITSNSIYISTWQSIYKMPKSYFEQFDVVYGDEAHLFKSKSLTAILHKCINATHRVGTTGTLDGTKTHRLVLEGLFGVVHRVTTTKKLMDTNQLAQLKITCVQLNYSDEEKKLTKNFSYQEEIDWIVTHPKRNKFIRNLVIDRKGNTLVLFQYVEKHGKVLHDLIVEAAADKRKVFFVHGGIEAEDRENIRAITENEGDFIILHFGKSEIKIPTASLVLLSNGTKKYANDITLEDDIDDGWLKSYLL